MLLDVVPRVPRQTFLVERLPRMKVPREPRKHVHPVPQTTRRRLERGEVEDASPIFVLGEERLGRSLQVHRVWDTGHDVLAPPNFVGVGCGAHEGEVRQTILVLLFRDRRGRSVVGHKLVHDGDPRRVGVGVVSRGIHVAIPPGARHDAPPAGNGRRASPVHRDRGLGTVGGKHLSGPCWGCSPTVAPRRGRKVLGKGRHGGVLPQGLVVVDGAGKLRRRVVRRRRQVCAAQIGVPQVGPGQINVGEVGGAVRVEAAAVHCAHHGHVSVHPNRRRRVHPHERDVARDVLLRQPRVPQVGPRQVRAHEDAPLQIAPLCVRVLQVFVRELVAREVHVWPESRGRGRLLDFGHGGDVDPERRGGLFRWFCGRSERRIPDKRRRRLEPDLATVRHAPTTVWLLLVFSSCFTLLPQVLATCYRVLEMN